VKCSLLAVQKYGYFSSHTKAVEGGDVPFLGDAGLPVHVGWLMTTAKIVDGPPQP